MSDSGHPSRFGYVQCGWCMTWIPAASARDDLPAGTHAPMTCRDAKWCSSQMGSDKPDLSHLPDPLGHAAGLALLGIDENGDAA